MFLVRNNHSSDHVKPAVYHSFCAMMPSNVLNEPYELGSQDAVRVHSCVGRCEQDHAPSAKSGFATSVQCCTGCTTPMFGTFVPRAVVGRVRQSTVENSPWHRETRDRDATRLRYCTLLFCSTVSTIFRLLYLLRDCFGPSIALPARCSPP